MPLTQFTITQRNLPHWHSPGVTYFLTWRVRDDRLLEPEDRTCVLNALRYWDEKKWLVYAAVVMPDHVHALVRPLPIDLTDPFAEVFHDLSNLTQSVKGYSAHQISRRHERRGSLWQDESFDRIVRDERERDETWEYIRFNPVRAGLVEVPELYPWLYQTVRTDWTRPG